MALTRRVGVTLSQYTLAVSAPNEESCSTTIVNGAAAASGSLTGGGCLAVGAVYTFEGSGGDWSLSAYLKAPNGEAEDHFGSSLACDGDSLVAGAWGEDSCDIGVASVAGSNNDCVFSGAVYVFSRGTTGDWSFQAYVKSPNTGAHDLFGERALQLVGRTLAIGARYEGSCAIGILQASSAADDGCKVSEGYVHPR